MRYEIEVTKHFERLLRKLDIEIIKRIRDKILELKTDPYANKPLVGQLSGLRSMRVGDCRILYMMKKKKSILVHVEHRRVVYR